jgi:hypothetical protein
MPARRVLVSPQGSNLLKITTASPLPVGEVTAPYSFTFSAINGTPPYHWSETGSLPAGFTLSSGGVLSGTPGATFSGSFNVTVTDSLTPVASHFTAAFSFTIVAAVSITTSSPLPNATQGSSYSDTMAATGGVTPYTWSLLSQTGSNSWSVSSAGVVAGTPANIETDVLNIQVADALSVVSSANFNLQVVSGSSTFDFFMSQTGDDNNAGTLGSPWSVTAFNSKSATYSGKKIGIIGDAGVTLSGVTLTGTAGQFSCNAATLSVGQYVMISGTFGGTGSIAGYATGTIYAISVTNGSTTFTLTPLGGDFVVAAPALVTTAGTPTGLTYALNNPITQGTVGGVHTTLLSLINGSANQPALNVNGGTSAASTYVGSCNSSGVYTPRWAILDFSPAGPSGVTSGNYAMGQNSESATQVPKPGFLTYDGLTVRNFSFAAIVFRNDGGSAITNCVIENCDVYNGGNIDSLSNPGALHLSNTLGTVINNCKVHGLKTIAGGADPAWGNSAVMTYGITGAHMNLTITNCTFYNCPSVLTKDANQDVNMSYCYLDSGIFGSGAFGDLNAGIPAGLCPASGVTSSIHHNIMLRGVGAHAQDSNTTQGIIQLYNNTIYGASSGGPGLAAIYMGAQAASGASVQFYQNIVYSTNGYDAGTSSASISVDLNQGWSIANATFNNNVYGFGMTFGVQNDVTLGSFAAWKTASSCDANSVVLGNGVSPFSGTPSSANVASFTTNSNAVIGSITCGALDGSGSVGCNF